MKNQSSFTCLKTKKQKKYYDKIVEIPKVHHMVNIKIK